MSHRLFSDHLTRPDKIEWQNCQVLPNSFLATRAFDNWAYHRNILIYTENILGLFMTVNDWGHYRNISWKKSHRIKFRISQKHLLKIFFFNIQEYILKEKNSFRWKFCDLWYNNHTLVLHLVQSIRYRYIFQTEIFGMGINDKQFLYTKKLYQWKIKLMWF